MISKAIVAGASRKWVGLVAFASFVAVNGKAWAQSEQQELVNSAETTFSNFTRDPDMTWFQRHVGSAKAVLIAPRSSRQGGFSVDRVVAPLREPIGPHAVDPVVAPSCLRATTRRDAGKGGHFITSRPRASASKPVSRCLRLLRWS